MQFVKLKYCYTSEEVNLQFHHLWHKIIISVVGILSLLKQKSSERDSGSFMQGQKTLPT